MKYAPWGDEPVFEWDDGNEEHLWKHRVTIFEVEDCFDNAHKIRPHPKAKSDPEGYGDRYLVIGSTNGGRKLFMVVQYRGGSMVRPITAMDL